VLKAGRRWVSLGRASQMLNMNRRTLVRHLDGPEDSGFAVLERLSESGKRLRYLRMDQIRRAMGDTLPKRSWIRRVWPGSSRGRRSP
jgi:hypothetical protein